MTWLTGFPSASISCSGGISDTALSCMVSLLNLNVDNLQFHPASGRDTETDTLNLPTRASGTPSYEASCCVSTTGLCSIRLKVYAASMEVALQQLLLAVEMYLAANTVSHKQEPYGA